MTDDAAHADAETRQAIADALRGLGPANTITLFRRVGGSRQAFARALAAMSADGTVASARGRDVGLTSTPMSRIFRLVDAAAGKDGRHRC